MVAVVDRAFWHGKRVLLTGHTGFKGSWLMLWLQTMGANVVGLSDEVHPLFAQLGLDAGALGDVCRPGDVARSVEEAAPQVVFHLAAQSLVRVGYQKPHRTWDTNVMGTLNVLDALRGHACAVVVVTTDKVYENLDSGRPFVETDRLGGHDPYSASKAAAEVCVDSFRKSFDGPLRIATARAGNVIGGGDWAQDRIVPDFVRARTDGTSLEIRNPASTRPWQHVLDPLAGYLMLAQALYEGADVTEAFNFGPDANAERPVKDLIDAANARWPGDWHAGTDPGPHEAGRLTLSSAKARERLGWTPRWDFDETVSRTLDWYKSVHDGADPRTQTVSQIQAFTA